MFSPIAYLMDKSGRKASTICLPVCHIQPMDTVRRCGMLLVVSVVNDVCTINVLLPLKKPHTGITFIESVQHLFSWLAPHRSSWPLTFRMSPLILNVIENMAQLTGDVVLLLFWRRVC